MDTGIKVVMEGLALLAAAFTGGLRAVYGTDAWRGEEKPFWKIWKRKSMYLGTGGWLLLLGAGWLTAGLSGVSAAGRMQVSQMADLFMMYGILAVIDMKQKIVPDRMLICYLTGQLIMEGIYISPERLISSLVSGAAILILFMIISRLSGGRAGMGDAKLLGVTAMTAGWVYTLQLACMGLILSFIYSIGLLLFRRTSMKTEIPFVPFLAAGMAVHMIYFVM